MNACQTNQLIRLMSYVLMAEAMVLGSKSASAQMCGEWRLVSEAGPTARRAHAMAYDSARGVTVLFGGMQPYRDDTWEWDGVEWAQVATTGPGTRSSHAMAYDSARDVTVLFGGYDGSSYRRDTWEWDGGRWVHVSNTGPAERASHAMCYDSARAVTVLFGGESASSERRGDTWEWDGVQWRQVAETGPTERKWHAMAYDSLRSVTVLFGGWNFVRFEDTWEWDGAEWRQVATTGPSPRASHAMAFDSARGVTVLFGGSLYRDTWDWNGMEWTRIATTGPSPRNQHAMVYDNARATTVLLGGQDAPLLHGDTWEWRYDFWIAEHPQDQVAAIGTPATFSVTVGGAQRPRFQWRRDGRPLSDGGTIFGANTERLTISRVFPSDRARYDCVLSDDCAEITSRAATLYVVDPALQVSPTCPGGGPISISWEYASPGGQVALIFALNTGRFMVPQGYPCAGTRLGLGANQIQLAWQGAAGAEGSRTINGSAGPAACGGYFQLVDLTHCVPSNVVRVE